MDKEVLSSSQDGEICGLSVLSDPSNENSTKIKQMIRILEHPKNLIEVLRAELAIEKGLIGNAITTGPTVSALLGLSSMGKLCASLI